MAAARRHGTIVSFDLNYRPSLWKALGGTDAAAAANGSLVEQVDALFGNEEDFSAALGFSIDGVEESHTGLDLDSYRDLHARVLDAFPRLALVATSLREAHTATLNDWSGVCSTPRRVLRRPLLPAARDLRPHRRRRLLRLRSDLRSARRTRYRPGPRLRRRARRPRHDDAGRHLDGDARRCRAAHRREGRPCRALACSRGASSPAAGWP